MFCVFVLEHVPPQSLGERGVADSFGFGGFVVLFCVCVLEHVSPQSLGRSTCSHAGALFFPRTNLCAIVLFGVATISRLLQSPGLFRRI